MPEIVVPRPARYAHRGARVTVTVTDAGGSPLADAVVNVAQTRHAFAFGNIGFDLIPLASGESEFQRNVFGGARGNLERLGELYVELFNTATLPFYWARVRAAAGPTRHRRLIRTAALVRRARRRRQGPSAAVAHACRRSGCWRSTDDEVETRSRARIREIVADFAGLIDTWDAINEAVIMPVFDQGATPSPGWPARAGGSRMVRLAFEEARAREPGGDPGAQRLRPLSRTYECLIEGVSTPAFGSTRSGCSRTCTRATGARRRSHAHPRPVRPVRPAAAPDRDHPGLRPPDAARDRRSQRLPDRRVADRRPRARRARPTRSSGTTAPCSPTRPFRA